MGGPQSNRRLVIRLALITLSLLFGALLLMHRADLDAMLVTLRGGRPGWLALALFLEAACFLNQTALYQSLYGLLGLPASLRQLLPIVLAGNFVNFATPSASLGAVPLFVADANRRGLDISRVVLINLLRLTLNLVWFSLPLVASLAILAADGRLRLYQLAAGGIVVGAAALISLGLILAGRRPQQLGDLLGVWAARAARLSESTLHRAAIDPQRVHRFGVQLGQAALVLRHGGRRLLRPGGHAVATDALQFLILAATLRAFPGAGSIGFIPLVVTFTIGILFSVVAITPQGVGSAEAATIAALMSFGIPLMRAAAVVLAYRGFTFWLPFLVGFVALHLGSRSKVAARLPVVRR